MKKIITFFFALLFFSQITRAQVTNIDCASAIRLYCGQAKDVDFVSGDSAVWFKFEGTGDILHASFCGYVRGMTLFEGSCDTLTEINTTRGLITYSRYVCNDTHSREIGIKTEMNKTYYLQCKARLPQLQTRINITCSVPVYYNFCETAKIIGLNEQVVVNQLTSFSSLRNDCSGFYEEEAADVWFKYEGTGDSIFLEDAEPFSPLRVNFLEGECGDSLCTSIFTLYGWKKGFATRRGQDYFFRVIPRNNENQMFQLKKFSLPANDDCVNAQDIIIGDTLLIDLEYTTRSTDLCFNSNQPFDLWYKFQGSGQLIDFEGAYGTYMSLNVLEGDCDTTECISLTSTSTNKVFQSEVGVDYLLQVKSGRTVSSNKITQNITVKSYEKVANTDIDQAVELSCGDTLKGTFTGALTSDFISNGNRPIVWYKVKGNNEFFSIASGYLGNGFSRPSFTYHKKRGAELIYGGNSNVPIYLEKDSTIYIAVDGRTITVDFVITKTCTSQIRQDSCVNAQSITLQDTITASTSFGRNISKDGCRINGKTGVWYTFQGTGQLMDFTFESENRGHNYTISKGSCDSLICVSGYGVVGTNATRYFIDADETYFVHVYNEFRVFEGSSSKFYFTPLETATNDVCVNATVVNCGQTIIDSLDFALANDTSCTDDISNSRGIWYQLSGEGKYYEISANQPAVYEGTCEGLICLDEKVKDYRGKQVFLGEAGKKYYLFFQGNGRLQFDINCFEKEQNNTVAAAIPINCDFAYRGYAFEEATPTTPLCGDVQSYADIWLKFDGNDEFLHKMHQNRSGNFKGDKVIAAEVFTLNGKDSLICFGNFSNSGFIDRIFLPKGATYYIRLAFSNNTYNSQFFYDFNLTFFCTERITNFLCTHAITLECGDTLTVNTSNSVINQTDKIPCWGNRFISYPAWYKIEGNNSWMKLNATDLENSFNTTQVWIYEGDCTVAECLPSSGIFFAEQGTNYNININGFLGRKKLELTCVEEANNNFCEDAIPLVFGDTVYSSANFATSCQKGKNCYNDEGNKTIWYTIKGTGEMLNLKLIPSSNFGYSLGLAIYEGQCCDQREVTNIYGNNRDLYLKSKIDKQYLIAVETSTEPLHNGDFKLIGSISPVDSLNICESGVLLRNNSTEIVNFSTAIAYPPQRRYTANTPMSWVKLKGSGGIDTLTLETNNRINYDIIAYPDLNGNCYLSNYSMRNIIGSSSNSFNNKTYTIATLENVEYAIGIINRFHTTPINDEVKITLNQDTKKNACKIVLPQVVFTNKKEETEIPIGINGLDDNYFLNFVSNYFSNVNSKDTLKLSFQESGLKLIEFQGDNCVGHGMLPVIVQSDSICTQGCINCCCENNYFNEQQSIDLSNNPLRPTIPQLTQKLSIVTSCQQVTPKDEDYFTFNIPKGYVLNGLEIIDFSADNENSQAFIGTQAGTSFQFSGVSPTANDLLGGTDYGIADKGTNILPKMGQLANAEGFSSELGAGNYTIWLNQVGASSCVSLKFLFDVKEQCLDQIVFDNENIPSGVHSASNRITTNGTVSPQKNNEVYLTAGSEISLTSGFYTKENTDFTATIENCVSTNQANTHQPRVANAAKQTNVLNTELSVRPNPFYSSTFIAYHLKIAQAVNLDVYNMNGQLVKRLVDAEQQESGVHSYEMARENLIAGVYVIILSTPTENVSKKVVLLP